MDFEYEPYDARLSARVAESDGSGQSVEANGAA